MGYKKNNCVALSAFCKKLLSFQIMTIYHNIIWAYEKITISLFLIVEIQKFLDLYNTIKRFNKGYFKYKMRYEHFIFLPF